MSGLPGFPQFCLLPFPSKGSGVFFPQRPFGGMKKQGSFSLAGATKLSLSFSRSKKAAAAASAAASSVDTGMAASVNHENRPTVSTIDPIDMQVGDLALQFRDGGWTSTDTSGNARTLTVPPGRPSSADAAEMERVKKENEALRGEVCMPTPAHTPVACHAAHACSTRLALLTSTTCARCRTTC